MFELFPALTACEAQTPVPKNRSQQTSLSDRVSCFVRGGMILYHPDVEIFIGRGFRTTGTCSITLHWYRGALQEPGQEGKAKTAEEEAEKESS